MNHLIIYAHPNPASFSNAIAETVKNKSVANGDQIDVIDLYADNFNPVLSGADFMSFQQGKIPEDIAAYQEKIKWADHMTFVYPVWWNQMPAMMKGFIDRVFSYGFAFAVNEDGSTMQLLKGKSGSMITNLGQPKQHAEGTYTDALKLVHSGNILGFCGVEVKNHIFNFAVPSVDDATRKGYLAEIEAVV